MLGDHRDPSYKEDLERVGGKVIKMLSNLCSIIAIATFLAPMVMSSVYYANLSHAIPNRPETSLLYIKVKACIEAAEVTVALNVALGALVIGFIWKVCTAMFELGGSSEVVQCPNISASPVLTKFGQTLPILVLCAMEAACIYMLNEHDDLYVSDLHLMPLSCIDLPGS